MTVKKKREKKKKKRKSLHYTSKLILEQIMWFRILINTHSHTRDIKFTEHESIFMRVVMMCVEIRKTEAHVESAFVIVSAFFHLRSEFVMIHQEACLFSRKEEYTK